MKRNDLTNPTKLDTISVFIVYKDGGPFLINKKDYDPTIHILETDKDNPRLQKFVPMTARNTKSTLDKLTSLLNDNKPAHYTRFGDADLLIMGGRNCVRHNSTEKIREELIEAINIQSDLFIKGVVFLYPTEKGMLDYEIEPWKYQPLLQRTAKEYIENDKEMFYNPVLFHYLACCKRNHFTRFINKYVWTKKKMFIGSRAKEKMEVIFGPIDHYIQTPPRNAYDYIDTWWELILENIHDVDMVIPAVGQTARVIQKRLHNLDVPVYSIDFGSIVDVLEMDRPRRPWLRIAGDDIRKRFVKNNYLLTGERYEIL